jgi:hypothetical protein
LSDKIEQHTADIKAVEAKYAEMGQEKAYDTALIRSLQGALEQAKRETDDFKRVKEVYRRGFASGKGRKTS